MSTRQFVGLTALLVLLSTPLFAQAFLVKDIAPGTSSAQTATPTEFVVMDGLCYFAMENLQWGRELWVTDGTDAGTHLVLDINSGMDDSNPTNLTVVGSTLFFAADDGTNGVELWKSDGTATGTAMVADHNTAGDSNPTDLVAFNGECYFASTDGGTGANLGLELQHSDGTTITTIDINVGAGDSDVDDLTVVDTRLYLTANDGTDIELYVSTGANATKIDIDDQGATSSSPAHLAAFGTSLYCAATSTGGTNGNVGTELWSHDGTTLSVIDILVGAGSSSPTKMTEINGLLFFSADNTGINREPWVSDGTGGGTNMIQDLNPAGGSNPTEFTEYNGLAVFSAQDNTPGVGKELYTSDGTTATLYDINAGAGSAPAGFTVIDTALYFSANGDSVPGEGRELWSFDGVATALVSDIDAGAGNSNPSSLINYNSTLIFAADDGSTGPEVWSSDGTGVGTTQVKDIGEVALDSSPGEGIFVGGVYYFAADDGVNGVELWKSDGTEAGTTMVADINDGLVDGIGDSNPSNFAELGGFAYFAADDGTNGVELWRSDGTTTEMVVDLTSDATSSSPSQLAAVANAGGLGTDKIFFVADDGTSGQEVWWTDGATTTMLDDINVGAGGSDPQDLAATSTRVLFSATDGTGRSLYYCEDGTTATLILVNGNTYSDPGNFWIRAGLVAFSADDGATGYEPWFRNGTDAPISMDEANPGPGDSNPTDIGIGVSGANIYFIYSAEVGGDRELYASVTTDLITFTAGLVSNINGAGSSNPSKISPEVTGFGLTFTFYSIDDGANGRELWVSTGALATTLMVSDINPTGDSNPSNLALFGASTVYFVADDGGTLGNELWSSNGAAVTSEADINPGSASSSPSNLVSDTDFLILAAEKNGIGRELWALPFQTAAIAVDDPAATNEDTLVTINVVANDGGVTPAVVSFDSTSTEGGTVALNGADLDYTPAEDFAGTDTFTYTIKDAGGDYDTATVTVTVTAVADTPSVRTVPMSVAEDAVGTALNYAFVATPTDADGSEFITTYFADNVPTGSSFSAGTDNGGGQWEFTAAQLSGLTFTLPADHDTDITLSITATSEETSNADTATGGATDFLITISPTNEDNPVINPAIGDQNINEGSTLTIDVGAVSSDPDTGDTLTYTIDAAAQALGMAIDPNTGIFTWTPPEGTGTVTESVTITVTDNSGSALTADETINIDVEENTPLLDPVADVNIEENKQVQFTATATDPGPFVDNLTFSLLNEPAGAAIGPASGIFVWTPSEADYSSSNVFSITVVVTNSDGLTDSDVFDITVDESTPVLDPIGNQATPSGILFELDLDATDPDASDVLIFTKDFGGGTLDANTGEFSWTPSAGFVSQVVTFTVTDDNGLIDSETITILENFTPVIAAISDKTIAEGNTLSLSITATDANATDTLTYSLDANAIELGAIINSSSGAFTWTPGDELGGATPVTITVTVSDGILEDTEDFTVTVVEANSTPYFTSTPVTTATPKLAYSYSIIATDDDIPSQISLLAITPLAQLPSWLTLTDHGNGLATLSGTPSTADIGTHTISLKVTDDDLSTDADVPLSGAQTFNIKVTGAGVVISSGGGDAETSLLGCALQSANTTPPPLLLILLLLLTSFGIIRLVQYREEALRSRLKTTKL